MTTWSRVWYLVDIIEDSVPYSPRPGHRVFRFWRGRYRSPSGCAIAEPKAPKANGSWDPYFSRAGGGISSAGSHARVLPGPDLQPTVFQRIAGRQRRSRPGMRIRTMDRPDRSNSLPARSAANNPFAVNAGQGGVALEGTYGGTRGCAEAATPPLRLGQKACAYPGKRPFT